MWSLQTDDYLVVERTLDGDTVRTFRGAFDPVPVTREDVDRALESLSWFEGRVDRGRIPDTHPPVQAFLRDDLDHTWVLRSASDSESETQGWDVFSPEGIYQGGVELPYEVAWTTAPVFRNGFLYGLVRDELGVSFIVKARIHRDSDIS